MIRFDYFLYDMRKNEKGSTEKDASRVNYINKMNEVQQSDSQIAMIGKRENEIQIPFKL